MNEKERINQYLASCGVGSRRAVESLIVCGRVSIEDRVATLSSYVSPQEKVYLDGKRLSKEPLVYYLFHKPVSTLTTLSDPKNRKTIQFYLSKIQERVFPVGRLDFDSSGLLLLTNDGKLSHQLAHPKYHVEKEYEVMTSRDLSPEEEEKFRQGIPLEEGLTKESQLRKIEKKSYQVVLKQGWYRQIRRMFDFFGVEVIALKRIRIGSLKLSTLKEGEYVQIRREMIKNS